MKSRTSIPSRQAPPRNPRHACATSWALPIVMVIARLPLVAPAFAGAPPPCSGVPPRPTGERPGPGGPEGPASAVDGRPAVVGLPHEPLHVGEHRHPRVG